MIAHRSAACVLLFGLFAGCSSHAARQGDPETTDFQELSELLHAAASGAGRPPARLADLDRFRGNYMKAYDSVKSGDVVVLWGTPMQGEGDSGKGEVLMAY